MPPALLDRMVEGPDRVVAAGEAFSGGAGITLHAQGKLPIADINYGYITLGLARAYGSSTQVVVNGSLTAAGTAFAGTRGASNMRGVGIVALGSDTQP